MNARASERPVIDPTKVDHPIWCLAHQTTDPAVVGGCLTPANDDCMHVGPTDRFTLNSDDGYIAVRQVRYDSFDWTTGKQDAGERLIQLTTECEAVDTGPTVLELDQRDWGVLRALGDRQFKFSQGAYPNGHNGFPSCALDELMTELEKGFGED